MFNELDYIKEIKNKIDNIIKYFEYYAIFYEDPIKINNNEYSYEIYCIYDNENIVDIIDYNLNLIENVTTKVYKNLTDNDWSIECIIKIGD